MVEWYIYAIGSSIFATAFALARKKALLEEHALEFESARSLCVALILLMFLPFMKLDYPWYVIGLIYIVSLISSLGILLISKSYRHSQISLIFPLANLKPMFILILAFLFLGEGVTIKHLMGIGIALLSAYALEANHHFDNLFEPIKNLFRSKYNIYFISAILLFSITSIFDKYIISNFVDPLSFLFLAWTFIAVNLNIIHGIKYGFGELNVYFRKKTYTPFLVAFFSIGANILYLHALKLAYVSLVAPVGMLSTLFVVLLGGRFFKEDDILYRLSISILMLVGVYLIIT